MPLPAIKTILPEPTFKQLIDPARQAESDAAPGAPDQRPCGRHTFRMNSPKNVKKPAA